MTLGTVELAVARLHYKARPFCEWVVVFVIQSVFCEEWQRMGQWVTPWCNVKYALRPQKHLSFEHTRKQCIVCEWRTEVEEIVGHRAYTAQRRQMASLRQMTLTTGVL